MRRLALLLALAPALARPCDSSTCSLLTRGQGGLVARGAVQVDASFRLTEMGTPLQGGQVADAALRPKVDPLRQRLWPDFHRETGGRERFVQVDVTYGLAARTALVASLTASAHRRYDVTHTGTAASTYVTDGVGDAQIGARHAFGPLVAGLSLKLPIGDYRLGPDLGGGPLDPTLQPGTGTLDLVASLQWRLPRRAAGLDWTLAGSYQANDANDLDYRFGDESMLTLTGGRRLSARLSVSAQAKLARRARSRFLAAGVPSTGSTILYGTPGARLSLPAASAVYGYLQIPLLRHVNDTQLAPSWGFLVGLSRTF